VSKPVCLSGSQHNRFRSEAGPLGAVELMQMSIELCINKYALLVAMNIHKVYLMLLVDSPGVPTFGFLIFK